MTGLPHRPLPTITGTIWVHIADCPHDRQHHRVWDRVAEAPPRAHVCVYVDDQLASDHAIQLLAELAEAKSLTVEIEGAPRAVRYWVTELRRCVTRIVTQQYAENLAERRRGHLRVVDP